MKKNIYYLMGFLIVIVVNYLIKKYAYQDYSENLNQINLYNIIENGLRPIGFFLLFKFLFTKSYSNKNFYTIYYNSYNY